MSSRAHSSATSSSSSSSSSNSKVRIKAARAQRILQVPIPRQRALSWNIMAYVLGASRDVRFMRKKVTTVILDHADPVADENVQLYWVRDKKYSSLGALVQSQEPPFTTHHQPVPDGQYVAPMGGYYGAQYYGYGGQAGVSGGKQQHEAAAHETRRPQAGVPPPEVPYASGAMPPPPQGDA